MQSRPADTTRRNRLPTAAEKAGTYFWTLALLFLFFRPKVLSSATCGQSTNLVSVASAPPPCCTLSAVERVTEVCPQKQAQASTAVTNLCLDCLLSFRSSLVLLLGGHADSVCQVPACCLGYGLLGKQYLPELCCQGFSASVQNTCTWHWQFAALGVHGPACTAFLQLPC